MNDLESMLSLFSSPAFGSGLPGVALGTLLEKMMVDAPWCWGQSPSGFFWLGHRLTQTIEASEPFESRGLTVVRISATTVVADRVPPTDALPAHLDALNRMEIGSRWLHDADTGQLLLTCSTLVHTETLSLRMSDLAGNALMQIARAEALVSSGVAEALGGQSAFRIHPEHGPRSVPDEMLHILDGVYVPHGREPSRYRSASEFAEAGDSLEGSPFFSMGSSAEGIAAEVAVGDDTLLIQLFSDVAHPLVGSGLLTTIRCRMAERGGDPGEGADLALMMATALNRAETDLDGPGSGFGAWHTHTPDGAVAEVAHTAFVPNASFLPGRARDALWGAIDRALWLSRQLAPDRDPLRGTSWDALFRMQSDAELDTGALQ